MHKHGVRLGRVFRDAAVQRVESANFTMVDLMVKAVRAAAKDFPEGFTSDEAWARLDECWGERRAMGAAFTRLRRAGEIKPTPRYRPSARPECHARPVRIWRLA